MHLRHYSDFNTCFGMTEPSAGSTYQT